MTASLVLCVGKASEDAVLSVIIKPCMKEELGAIFVTNYAAH